MYAFVRSNVPRALSYTDDSSSSKTEVRTIQKDPEPELSTNSNTASNGEVGKGVSSKNTDDLRHRNHSNPSEGENLERRRRTLSKRDSWISWDDQESPCPEYSKYLYFLFVPTLIYKDTYPRYKYRSPNPSSMEH